MSLDKNTLFLSGLEVHDFCGFSKPLHLDKFSKLNIFIGENNSGKSSILRAIELLNINTSLEDPYLTNVYSEKSKYSIDYYFTQRLGGIIFSEIEQISKRYNPRDIPFTDIEKEIGIIKNSNFIDLDNRERLRDIVNSTPLDGDKIKASIANSYLDLFLAAFIHDFERYREHIKSTRSLLIKTVPDNTKRYWIETLIHNIVSQINSIAPVFIPAKRIIGKSGEPFEDASGKGLLYELARLERPDLSEYQRNRLKFKKIENFFRELTGKPQATLEVPHNRKHLQVYMDNKRLPLESLGTGVHDLVLLASFCTINENKIICIEEPETHLHPTLQRRLLPYLAANTNNQYFITTHSAALLDYKDAHVFQVQNDGQQATVSKIENLKSKHELLLGLGYRPSDLLQANYVIWVEGPSDRIYIRHWLETYDSELLEGVHYQIMFYGGGLISHLDIDDTSSSKLSSQKEADKLIELQKLSRASTIVMDSDRRSPEDTLKVAAKRIWDSHAKGVTTCRVWITAGKEIENYLECEVVQKAIGQIHSNVKQPFIEEPDENDQPQAPEYRTKWKYLSVDVDKEGKPKVAKADKVKLANKLTEAQNNRLRVDILDLSERLAELSTAVRRANHML